MTARRRLIVNAGDSGQSAGVNRGVIAAHVSLQTFDDLASLDREASGGFGRFSG